MGKIDTVLAEETYTVLMVIEREITVKAKTPKEAVRRARTACLIFHGTQGLILSVDGPGGIEYEHVGTCEGCREPILDPGDKGYVSDQECCYTCGSCVEKNGLP